MRIHWTVRVGVILAAFFLLTGIRGAGPGWDILIGGCIHTVVTGELPIQTEERERQERFARAGQGDAKTQYEIGHEWLFVQRVESTFEDARLWLCRSAAQGHAPAQYDLGLLYSGDLDRRMVTFGVDFPREDAQAYKWLTLAARGGHAKAGSRLAELSKTITPADKARGEQLLENWRTGPCGPPMISG